MKKKILAISGSVRQGSSNHKLISLFASGISDIADVQLYEGIDVLPHFNPDLTDNPPQEVADFRQMVVDADAVLICTPEYVFSIPGSLKNAIEWCVSTTVFKDKKLGIITASASGEKGHEELQMIMKTLEADFTEDTALLIQGVRGKLNTDGEIIQEATRVQFNQFIANFVKHLT